jgi:hypothetical protein
MKVDLEIIAFAFLMSHFKAGIRIYAMYGAKFTSEVTSHYEAMLQHCSSGFREIRVPANIQTDRQFFARMLWFYFIFSECQHQRLFRSREAS